jgi:adenosylcobyric acid synthase
MALNSFVTREGHEIGRAQAVQAQACRLWPNVNMNPVLIKPSSDCKAQVVVMGKPAFDLPAEEFPTYKTRVESYVRLAYQKLAEAHDVVVLEGAGSPAEINLRDGDIVNMAMAEIADAPVILVGDIDKGGVFASFVGTLELLQPEERNRIKGFIINKFRGEQKLLKPAIDFLETRTGRPVLGVVPYFTDIKIPEEDSLSSKASLPRKSTGDGITISIMFLPHVSNFTDFDPFEGEPDVNLRYLRPGEFLAESDLVILPGTKNTVGDLLYLREKRLDQQLLSFARNGGALIGICGGYQIMGTHLYDPHGVESETKEVAGLGLLDVSTIFLTEKHLYQVEAVHLPSGLQTHGYEIHMGETERGAGLRPAFHISRRNSDSVSHGRDGDCPSLSLAPKLNEVKSRAWRDPRASRDSVGTVPIAAVHEIDDGAISPDGRILGTYIHGLFDDDTFRRHIIDSIRVKKGIQPLCRIMTPYNVDAEYDKLAALLREHLDMERVYEILKAATQVRLYS